MKTNDPNRPDGFEERLVRIETRMVKYQEQNTLHIRQLVDAIAELQRVCAILLERKHGETQAE